MNVPPTPTPRACPCCKWPCKPFGIHHGTYDGVHVVIGLCQRCERANLRLPAGTVQKRLNAAGALAARDTTNRYYGARFADPGAAQLSAHLLGHADTGKDAAKALGWIE